MTIEFTSEILNKIEKEIRYGYLKNIKNFLGK